MSTNLDPLFSSGKDDWETPHDLFYELNEEFHFTLDPCCTPETAKCEKYYTEKENGLIQNWDGERVFCNPPYSSGMQDQWVRKCYEHGTKGYLAVMLIPARTDTKRFHDYILNHENVEIRYIRGRLKFGDSSNSAPFPSMIVIFGRKGKVRMKRNNNFRPPESLVEGTEETLVLVDYSNLLYRAWFVSSKRAWVAYCKFFDMLRLCVKRSKQKGVPLKVIFAGESKTKLKRCDIFEGYKGNRKPINDDKFQKFRSGLEDIIRFLGWEVVSVEGAEADDVIASIVNEKCHRCLCTTPCENCDCQLKYKTDVVIFSGDRDLQQCLAWDRVLIYRAPGLFLDRNAFELECGIPAAKYSVYKALIGDKSDNIKGVEGFGPVHARRAISAGCVGEDIWETGGKEAAEDFKLALSLVNLNTKLEVPLDGLYLGPPLIKGKEDEFAKKFDKGRKVLLEVQRLAEEF